jgi:hypothetical protein
MARRQEVAAGVENTHASGSRRRRVSSENKAASSVDHSRLENLLNTVITWHIHLYTR